MISRFIKLTIITFAFIAGLGALSLWIFLHNTSLETQLSDEVIIQPLPVMTNVCEAAGSADDFAGQLIVLEATTDALQPADEHSRRKDDEISLYPLNCRSEKTNTLKLKFGNYSGTNSDLIKVLETPLPMLPGDDTEPYREADIRITGHVTANSVIPTDIEIISRFRREFP